MLVPSWLLIAVNMALWGSTTSPRHGHVCGVQQLPGVVEVVVVVLGAAADNAAYIVGEL